MASCGECTPDRWGRHQPGCPRGKTPQRRSRKKGTPRRKPGEVMIAAHTSNWALVGEYQDSRGTWVSDWNCTVCSRGKKNTADRQNIRPGPEWHKETVSK